MKEDKRVLKGELMRVAILDASIQLIANEGIEHVSAAKIASAIGTSKSNVFHHYKTREAILLGVHDYISEGFEEGLHFEADSLESYFAMVGEALFEGDQNLNLYKAFFAFYNEGLFNEVLRVRLKSSTERLLETFERNLHEVCLRSEQFDYGLSETLENKIKVVSYNMLCFLDGVGLHWMLNPEQEYLQRAWGLQVGFWEAVLR